MRRLSRLWFGLPATRAFADFGRLKTRDNKVDTNRKNENGGTGLRTKVESILAMADVRVDGGRAWDIHVHDQRFYSRVLAQGSLGLGESYMDGWWECQRLDEFFHRVLLARLDTKVTRGSLLIDWLKATLFNLQRPSRAFTIGRRH